MGTEHDDPRIFESLRPELTGLAYRMLGDVGAAQDIVQEAWLRWQRREVEVLSPKAFLLTIVTRLCLNELDSARSRRERTRADRLPEPVVLGELGLEAAEQLSMAFLVLLERLSAAERAVFLLHDVFDLSHDEIGPLVARQVPACRKLLERAREKVAAGRRSIRASREEHERLLGSFLAAVQTGDLAQLVALLAADAVIVTDGGPGGRSVGRARNLPGPLEGAARVAAFVLGASQSVDLEIARRELNGLPAVVFYRDGAPFAALLLSVADGKVERIFFHGDLARLSHVGAHMG